MVLEGVVLFSFREENGTFFSGEPDQPKKKDNEIYNEGFPNQEPAKLSFIKVYADSVHLACKIRQAKISKNL